MKKKYAFTLVELLVVIAIISILVGIIFPVFIQAKEKANRTSCISNMRQISVAVMLYQQDNDDHYPPISFQNVLEPKIPSTSKNTIIFLQRIEPYLKNKSLRCPKALDYPDPTIDKIFLTGYTMNGQLQGTAWNLYQLEKEGDTRPHFSVAYPSLTVLICECSSFVVGNRNPDQGAYSYNDARLTDIEDWSKKYNESYGSTRHQGGANYVFCDGHARWYGPRSFVYPNNGKDPTFDYEEAGTLH